MDNKLFPILGVLFLGVIVFYGVTAGDAEVGVNDTDNFELAAVGRNTSMNGSDSSNNSFLKLTHLLNQQIQSLEEKVKDLRSHLGISEVF